MLTEQVQYQGKAGFLIEFSKWYFLNTSKCKVGGFYSDSHILHYITYTGTDPDNFKGRGTWS